MIGVFVGFSRIFLIGILILKGSLRDVFISRSGLNKGLSDFVPPSSMLSVPVSISQQVAVSYHSLREN
jgi:hypothetical protein